MDSRKNSRTPVALVIALGLLGLGGLSLASAATVPSLVREDVVVRTNPSTNLTPNDPGAMPTDDPGGTTSAGPSSTEQTTATAEPTVTAEPAPVEPTSATPVSTRNPVQSTDAADPVDPLPAEPVVEETTFNPVEPTTGTHAPTPPTN